MNRRSSRRSGFTLIELLVTVLVMAIGLGVIFALLTQTAEMGRDLRDDARLRRFADTVFASFAWQIVDPLPGSEPNPMTLNVLTSAGLTDANLDLTGEEAFWPPMDANELEPRRIRYRVDVVDTASGMREVTLTAGMWGELNPREFHQTFLLMEPGP